MKRRWRLWLFLALVLLLGGLLLLPQVRWPVYGWLRGEAFYRGMPTGYWQSELGHVNQPPSWMYSVLGRLGAARRDIEVFVDVEIVTHGGSTVFVPTTVMVPRDLLPKDPAVLPVLIALLRTGDPDVQVAAARLLRRLGEAAAAAVPALREAVGSPERNVRNAAVKALQEIDPEAAANVGVE